MTEPTREDLVKGIISDRQKLGFTIDQLAEKYPSFSRSAIGRIVKGLKRNLEESSEINDSNPEISTENTETLPIGEKTEKISFIPSQTEIGKVLPSASPESPRQPNSPFEGRTPKPQITQEEARARAEYIESALVEGVPRSTISQQIGISLVDLNRLYPEAYIQELQREVLRASAPPAVPTAHLIVPIEWIDDLEKNSPAQQQRILRGWKTNIIRYNENLERKARTQNTMPARIGNEGYPSFVRNAEDVLDYETAKLVKAKRRQVALGGNSPGFSWKEAIELIKFGHEVATPKQAGPDKLSIWKDGWLERQKMEAVNPSGAAKTNVDLRIEEMREGHDLDMAKLHWEQQKFMMNQSAEKEKWSAVSEMLKPVLAVTTPELQKGMKNLGRQVSKSLNLEGSPEISEMGKFVCPNCETALSIPLDKIPLGVEEIPIKCPKCQVVTLSKFQKTEREIPKEEKPSGVTSLRPKFS